jgi:hypothetical protein
MEVGLGIGVSHFVSPPPGLHIVAESVPRPNGLGYRCIAPPALVGTVEIALRTFFRRHFENSLYIRIQLRYSQRVIRRMFVSIIAGA